MAPWSDWSVHGVVVDSMKWPVSSWSPVIPWVDRSLHGATSSTNWLEHKLCPYYLRSESALEITTEIARNAIKGIIEGRELFWEGYVSLFGLRAILYLTAFTLLGFMVFVPRRISASVPYGKSCQLVDCLFDACGRLLPPDLVSVFASSASLRRVGVSSEIGWLH